MIRKGQIGQEDHIGAKEALKGSKPDAIPLNYKPISEVLQNAGFNYWTVDYARVLISWCCVKTGTRAETTKVGVILIKILDPAKLSICTVACKPKTPEFAAFTENVTLR